MKQLEREFDIIQFQNQDMPEYPLQSFHTPSWRSIEIINAH
jgi:hypothetical protein